MYQGRSYRQVDSHYTGFEPLETAFPWASIDRSELIEARFTTEFEPPLGLAHIFTEGTVTDYVRVYWSPSLASESDTIIVDPCPSGSQRDEYVIYRNINAEEYVGVWR